MTIKNIEMKLALIILVSTFWSLNAFSEEDIFHVSHTWVANQVMEIEKRAHDGDLIFQYDQSAQSPAVAEVQKNFWTHVGVLFQEKGKWFVFEAVGPVTKTPLRAFLFYTRDYKISIKRLSNKYVDLSLQKNIKKLKYEFSKYAGKAYDLIFQWNDNDIYCSELVYKMFDSAFSIQIGQLIPINSLFLDGPLAQQLIEARKYMLNGDSYLEEMIITPSSMFQDKKLLTVYESIWF